MVYGQSLATEQKGFIKGIISELKKSLKSNIFADLNMEQFNAKIKSTSLRLKKLWLIQITTTFRRLYIRVSYMCMIHFPLCPMLE